MFVLESSSSGHGDLQEAVVEGGFGVAVST